MKPWLFPQAAGALLGFLALTSGAALAQSADAVNPQSVAVEPSANEEPPPGSCKPIGFTVSGEIVFPMECKDFIERQKALDRRPAAQAKPAAAEEKAAALQENNVTGDAKPVSDDKPAAEEAAPAAAQEKAANAAEKPVARQSDNVPPATNAPPSEPAETGSLPKRAGRTSSVGPSGCTHFRTYHAASGTYKTFDGQVRPCREGNGKLVRK